MIYYCFIILDKLEINNKVILLITINKMDFKSRFEGKKSFINKRGDIVDSESKQVTTRRKPMQ